jgi:hypothetical protein
MLKLIISSLLFSTTATVSMVEFYQWNLLNGAGDGGSTRAVSGVSVLSQSETKPFSKPTIQSDYLQFLRLEIDSLDQVRVLEENIVPGKWHPRHDSEGARLYFEVVSPDNEVLASGNRPDPRRAQEQSALRKSASFVLSLPFHREAEQVNIYRILQAANEDTLTGLSYQPILSHRLQQGR